MELERGAQMNLEKETELLSETIGKMSLEEKARLVSGATFFGSFGLERLGVMRLQLLDGGTGINFEQLFGDMTEYYDWADSEECEAMREMCDVPANMIGSTALCNVIEYFFEPDKLRDEERPLYNWLRARLTERTGGQLYAPGCFPPGILLGATWNPQVVEKVGEALGMEACLFGVHILLGSPNVNIHRDPLNGRLFEGYSEDPCLISMLAPELVKGVQKYGVAANVKHFAANNQETNRQGIDEHISARALEEIYLPGFRACIQEGGARTLMNAYNQINGVPCTENRWLLTDKLRGEWDFDGMIVSDWGAVTDSVKALRAGTDLAMPGPWDYEPVLQAVKRGELDEGLLDAAVRRILPVVDWISTHFRADILDEISHEDMENFTDRAAYEAACEGIVMLKNDGTFPIAMGTRVSLCGSGAKELITCGTGSAGIHTDRGSSLYASLSDYLGQDKVFLSEDANMDTDSRVQTESELVLCVCSVPGMEGNDRRNLMLGEQDLILLKQLREQGKKTAIILNTCGPVELSEEDVNHAAGIFEVFLPGMEGARALADILIGKVNPSGKLPLTFPVRYEDTPTCMNFPGDGYNVTYGEGIYVGYRYYDRKKLAPRYAFGYGLSYTSFACSLCDVVYDDAERQARVEISVMNTGQCAGSEVVQVYVSDPYSTLSKPVKELKAFRKLYLEPGMQQSVTLVLPYQSFASYDMDLEKFTVEEGWYEIIAATSSGQEDVFGTKRIYVDVESPYRYGVNSTVKVVWEHQELKLLADTLWKEQGWDTGVIANNYQYTPGRKLIDIIEDVDKSLMSGDKRESFIRRFNERAALVRKC